MDKVKILVACHKPGPVYHDEVYIPIHVGRAISKFKEEMADLIGDDTGDNYSDKNPYYCELTAQYWAWKNLHDVEYIGFCHYRRFFDLQITNDNIGSLLKNYDVIMPKVVQGLTVEMDMIHYVTIEDVTIFLMVLKKMYPEYEQTTIDYLWNYSIHQKNMLICKKSLFDEYAEWIFGILEECEKYIKHSPYMRGKRALAYLGEFFMPVYFLYHHYRILNTSYVENVGNHKNITVSSKIKTLLKMAHCVISRPLNKKPSCFEDYYLPEVILSLNNDNINPNK